MQHHFLQDFSELFQILIIALLPSLSVRGMRRVLGCGTPKGCSSSCWLTVSRKGFADLSELYYQRKPPFRRW